MKVRKVVWVLISICFVAVALVGINTYAKKSAAVENSIDTVDGSSPVPMGGDDGEAGRVLVETPIEYESGIQEDTVGVDTTGGAIPIDRDESESRILMETPLEQ